MRQDQQLNSGELFSKLCKARADHAQMKTFAGSLASHAKPEALQTIAPLWNAYMSDISDLLAANRKIVVESTPSERCSEYAGHLVDAIKFVAPVENDTFPIVPVANQGLLMQIHPDQGENRNGTWSRSALLRPYKHCAKALAAREKAKEAVAASSQDDDSQLESSEWFVQEVQPYERLTPLTPLELRKLERRWANAGSLSQGSVAVSPSGDGAEDDSRAAAHPLPDTREEALLRDVFAGGFIASKSCGHASPCLPGNYHTKRRSAKRHPSGSVREVPVGLSARLCHCNRGLGLIRGLPHGCGGLQFVQGTVQHLEAAHPPDGEV